MRLIAAALLLSACAFAQTTTSITGTIKDLTQALVTSGKVTFTLQPSRDTTISGIARFSPNTVTCLINGSGQITNLVGGTCTVTMNTALNPPGSYYRVDYWPYNVKTSSFTFYAVLSSYDWSTVVPTPTTSPAQNFVDVFSNQTIAGNKTFSGTVGLSAGGSLVGTFSGNGTFTGNDTFTGQNKFSAYGIDNVVYIDGLLYACSDVGFNAAFASLPSTGGTVDARGCMGAVSVASTVTIGSGTKPATFLFNGRVSVTCTITNGTPCFTIAAGSQLWVDALTAIGTPGTYNFQLGGSANVSSLIENAPKDGTMPIGGIWIHGGLWGNNNGGTINGALIDLQGIFANSVIEDITTAGCKNATCVRVQPGTGANGGSKLFSDVLFLNDNINCSNATGCSPLLIQLPTGISGSSGVSVVNFQDSYVQDPGPNQRLLYINGNGVTNGISNVYFTNTDLELATPGGAQDCPVQITDAAHIKFDGVWTGGVSTGTNFLCISQSVSNATGDVVVNNFHDGVTGWANLIHNTISSVNITNKDFSDYVYGGTYAGAATVGIAKNWDTVPLNVLNGSVIFSNLLFSTTAPTIAAAGCGGSAAAISGTPNGTASFNVNVGTAPTSGGCTVTLPTAATGWNCFVTDLTTNSTSVFVQKQTGGSATTAILQNFSDVAVATAPSASDIYHVSCFAN